MFDKFDIQLFADENVEGEVADNSADEKIDIPEELSDVSEDIARNILREHADKNSAEVETPKPAEEFDAEGNYTGDGNIDNVKIAYSRFKETLDKQKDAEKQLAAYREKFGDLNAQPPTPQNNFQPALQENYQQQPQEEYYRAMTAKQSQSEYNDYVNQQRAVEYFDDLQKFAAGEFYQSQSDVDRQIIFDANLRIESGKATVAAIFQMRLLPKWLEIQSGTKFRNITKIFCLIRKLERNGRKENTA